APALRGTARRTPCGPTGLPRSISGRSPPRAFRGARCRSPCCSRSLRYRGGRWKSSPRAVESGGIFEPRGANGGSSPRMLYFGAFGFDVGTGRLTRGGAALPLGRTAARVLAVLSEHRPHAATQEGILRTVWPSHVVFVSATGESPLDARNFCHRVFQPALRSAGIANFRCHASGTPSARGW